MNMNTTILREISFQLTQGNPWWGMLLANEYLDHTNPLRCAFILRFKRSIGDAAALGRGSLADALIRGARKGALSTTQLASVGSRIVRKSRAVRFQGQLALGDMRRSPASTSRSGSSARLAVRQRNTRCRRFSLNIARECTVRASKCMDALANSGA